MANFGDMLQEYYVGKYRSNLQLRLERLAKINTPETAREYISRIQEKLKRTFQIPTEKSPLCPRVTGMVERPDFTLEKIIIESRKAFPVTLNLYLPKKRQGKVPAVVELLGHNSEGKAANVYQSFARSLAIKGCAVLLVDPVEQGERHQFSGSDAPHLCQTHNILGRQLKSLGDHFANWRLYDAVRAMDYLLTREEIDPARIGVTGNSGGGTLTTMASAIDGRYAAAAPSCYITRWVRNVENELPVDAEQIPPGFANDGGEMADLLIAAAPRPLLIMGQKNDFFDVRGTSEVFDEVRRIYELLGYGGRVSFFTGPRDHGYGPENRERAYAFFSEFLKFHADAKEPESTPVPEGETFCTPTGSTLKNPSWRTVQSFIREQAAEFSSGRPQLTDEVLKEKLSALLEIKHPVRSPYYRILRNVTQNNLNYSRFLLENPGEPGVTLTLAAPQAYFHIPEMRSAELYVPHQSVREELSKRSDLGETPVFGIDYRGVGESMPDGCDQNNRGFFKDYQFDYHFDSIAWLRGESLPGGRVRDILSAIELLTLQGISEIQLTASGIGEIPALFAAFLSRRKVKLQLAEKPYTYLENANSAFSPIPQSMIPAGILKLTDLDDLARRTAAKIGGVFAK